MDPAPDPLETEQKYRAPALEKGLDILELLTLHAAPMTGSQIASELGRSLTELFRMIQVLEFRGYVEAGPTGYQLTNRLFSMGMSRPSVRSLVQVALPKMQALADETLHSCHLVIRSGEDIVVILRVESPSDLSYSVRVGHRRPMIEATSGRLLFGLAGGHVQDHLRRRLTKAYGAERFEAFAQAAALAAEAGFVSRASDFVKAVTDLSAPVVVRDEIVATVNIPYCEQVLPRAASVDAASRELRAAALKIAAEMVPGAGV